MLLTINKEFVKTEEMTRIKNKLNEMKIKNINNLNDLKNDTINLLNNK